MNIKFFNTDIPNDKFAAIAASKSIAIDSETMGLNIRRDPLCLVQLGMESGEVYLIKIHPQFKYSEHNIAASPNLYKLLTDKNIVKILHYARFDIAVFAHYFNVDPILSFHNIYCTKIASKLVRTYGNQHGLRDLVRDIASIELDKANQCSDWSGELSESQMKYAANDVIYLHKIKSKLDVMLKQSDRIELAHRLMSFITTRVALDLDGWSEDIFSH